MSSIASLLFYLITFSLAALLMHYGMKRNNKPFIGLSLSIPILISSLRYDVGTDYITYVNIFDQLAPLSLTGYFNLQNIDLEIGFYFLIKLSDLLTGNYFPMLIISSFLIIFFFYLGLRKYNLKQTSIVYFLFLTTIFPFTFNGIRQGIAISICFYAFSFIITRLPKKYILWILIASLFHKSALFMLPFYFLNRIASKHKDLIVNQVRFILPKIAVLAIGMLIFLPYLFDALQVFPFFAKYSAYETIEAEGNNNIFYLKLIILSIAILFYKRILQINQVYIYILLFAVLDLVLSTLGFISPFIKRIALYFSLFSPILLASIPNIFSDRLGKFLSYAFLILYGLLYFYIAYYQMGQSDIFPYQFISGDKL